MDPTPDHGIRFGRRVLGDEEWSRQQEAKKAESSGGVSFGNRVMENGPEPETAAAAGEPTPETKPTVENPFATDDLPTIDETEEILANHPEFFDDALEAEVLSKDPRKGVLQLLSRIERDRSEPRASVLKALDTSIESLKE